MEDFKESRFQEGVHKRAIPFKSFIDFWSPIHGQRIRNKRRQRAIVIIKALKFNT
jgi:hypothetical protein